MCLTDLCHQSWQDCWGRSFGRGCRAQVEESPTQDGKGTDTPTHLVTEKNRDIGVRRYYSHQEYRVKVM